jgi:hypothetical protein
LDPIEDDPHLAALADLLAARARDLHRLFARAFGDMLLGKTRSFRDVSRALKAQNQCLPSPPPRAVCGGAGNKKIAKSNEPTIRRRKSTS